MSIVDCSCNQIKSCALEEENEIINMRRKFHANPELSWKEIKTTDAVCYELEKLGCEIIQRGFNGTSSGVVADIVGSGVGKCIALRADIDALPLNEENIVDYRSVVPGVMHACGHDAHAACLIGAARILSRFKDKINGRIRLFFQPAEETGITSGAKALIDAGMLNGVDAVFGIHVFTNVKSGILNYRCGPMMAANDVWGLTIYGKGGHGSAPEETIDPTITAFQLGSAFQSIISREISPKDVAVLTVGSVMTSSCVYNIIPERVEMKGTVRTFRPEIQDCMQNAMERVVSGIAAAFRCKIDFNYKRVVPSVVNDNELTLVLKEVGTELLGAESVVESPLIMASEDFSRYGHVVPSVFVSLGVGAPDRKETLNPHHSPKFDIDESQLYKASTLHAAFALRYLGSL